MKNIIYKIANNFDIKKGYKLYRFMQDISKIPINKKYKDKYIDLNDRKIKIRIFNNNKNNKKLIIYIHGGGWVAGSIKSYTNLCSYLSDKLNSIVISIDYRLAPEYPFPNGFNDCYDVVKIIYDNINYINILKEDITIIGDSAGGNIAAAIATKSVRKKEFKISKQVLIYPSLQTDYTLTTKYKSVLTNGYNNIINRKQLNDFIKHYIKDEKDLKNIYAAPLYNKKYFGYPKTLIFACKFDPLRDEAIAYHKKLKRHFINSKLELIDDTHGYLTSILDKKNTNYTINKIKEFINN